jgi:hypothetical protein
MKPMAWYCIYRLQICRLAVSTANVTATQPPPMSMPAHRTPARRQPRRSHEGARRGDREQDTEPFRPEAQE